MLKSIPSFKKSSFRPSPPSSHPLSSPHFPERAAPAAPLLTPSAQSPQWAVVPIYDFHVDESSGPHWNGQWTSPGHCGSRKALVSVPTPGCPPPLWHFFSTPLQAAPLCKWSVLWFSRVLPRTSFFPFTLYPTVSFTIFLLIKTKICTCSPALCSEFQTHLSNDLVGLRPDNPSTTRPAVPQATEPSTS